MPITKEFLQHEIAHMTKQLEDAKGQMLVNQAALSTLIYLLSKLDLPDVPILDVPVEAS